MYIMPAFSLHAESISFEGDFVFQTVSLAWLKLKNLITLLKADESEFISIDLKEVAQVDSTCLALLLALAREAALQGKSLHFSHIPDKMLALADVSGVAKVLFGDA